jgi:arylsulfatase A-like enzyme
VKHASQVSFGPLFFRLFFFVCVGTAAAAETQPNIVVILADDLGFGDLSCYGNKLVATPHIDRMASEGSRFTQFYVAAPICSPSRAALITGQYPGRWRITSYLQTRAGNKACEQADFLDAVAPSLPRSLKQAGYATAHIGKWHLGGGRDVVNAPKFSEYGYDLGLGTWESPEPAAGLGVKFTPWDQRTEPGQVPRHRRTEWMVDRTLEFLEQNASRPCFVNLWLDDTHTPYRPSLEQLAAVGAANPPAEGDGCRAVLHEMDSQLGRLLDQLRRPPHAGRTLVLFLGDNGALPTFKQQRVSGLRGSKLSLYEGGIREPFVAWWPGRVPAGRVDPTTVISSLDFFPTLCAIAGAALPTDYRSDGEELSRALLGAEVKREKSICWEYGRNAQTFAFPEEPYHRSPNLAIRAGAWKLLVNTDGTNVQLFDVVADPNETNDRASQQAETAARMRDQVIRWRKELPSAPIP